MEITITNLDEMCDLMCDNKLPKSCYRCKHTDKHWDEEPCGRCKGYTEYEGEQE